MNNKPMLNAYPDSLGGKLSDIAALLKKKEMQDTFSSFYILPSLYHSDLDRGFSVVDYNLNEELATIEDLSQLKELGIDLKLDFILIMLRHSHHSSRILWKRAMSLSTATFHRLEQILGRSWSHDGRGLHTA